MTDFEPSPEFAPKPNYDKLLADTFSGERPQLPQLTHNIALEEFEQSYEKFKRYPYHDGEHRPDVMKRSILWMEYIADKADIDLVLEDYEVIALSAPSHDDELEADGQESGEQQSATAIFNKLTDKGFKKPFASRVSNAVRSTEVDYSHEAVLMSYVLKAAPDIAAVSLVLADIGAVLTEDEDRIIIDASKVAAERLLTLKEGEIALNEVMAIFDKQPAFSKQRFLDLPRMLNHHIGPEKAKKVLDAIDPEQKIRILAQAALIADKHDYIVDKIKPIVNNPDKSPTQKAWAFAKVLHNLIHSSNS